MRWSFPLKTRWIFILITFGGSLSTLKTVYLDWKTNKITIPWWYLKSINLSHDEEGTLGSKYLSIVYCWNCVCIALLSPSRFEKSLRTDISSGSSVNLISDTTGNRSFLRLPPFSREYIYIHLTRRRINGVRRDRAPIDRSVLIFRLLTRETGPRYRFCVAFPGLSMRAHCFWRVTRAILQARPRVKWLMRELILGLDRQ